MKKIVTIQDISCIGKCSLTVALPIISSMGIETAVIPTAVLSTHTAFKDFTYRDLSLDIPLIQKHWKKENFNFNAIYTGYLGSINQIDMIQDFFQEFKTTSNFIFIDPVMGDNGKLYTGFNQKFATKMAKLCKMADIIVPNLTEASYMLKKEYKEEYTKEEIKQILVSLSNLGPKKVILTGVSFNKNELGVITYDKKTKKFFSYFKEKIDVKYHGTGDVFSSTCVAALVNNYSLEKSIKIATDFVWEAIKHTYNTKGKDAYGVDFEKKLGTIINYKEGSNI
ncbi:MAG: pyridoxamine kinase [Clostridia bacterium]|nr:pyridoxamine kinase [Clostridia bacterium]